MNSEIQRVLFGAQKQSLRQNEAIVNFIEKYLDEGNEDVEEKILSKLKYIYESCQIPDKATAIGREDILFLQYIVGVDAYEAIVSGCKGTFVSHAVGDNGKVVFDFDPSEEAYEAKPNNESLKKLSENKQMWEAGDGSKAATAEDKAYEIVRKIISMCPPSERKELPKDDVLAAIVLSENYWKVFG